MNDSTNANPLDIETVASGDGADVAQPDSTARENGQRWPNAALMRPSVAATDHGIVSVAHAAALDWAITKVADVWRESLARPLSLVGTTDVSAANQSDHRFGVVIRHKQVALEVLVSFDSISTRTMVNALTRDLADLAATNAPGPIANPTGMERGVLEYLAMLAVDRVLQQSDVNAASPVIESFLDAPQIERWLDKHETRSVPLALSTSGEEGFIRIYVSGWTDQHWSAVFAIAPSLGKLSPQEDSLDVLLALPAMQIQPEEMASMAVGDVVLLGVSDLQALSHRCELITSTHWKVGKASIVDDTPTYVDAEIRPCTPTLCDAAMDANLIRPVIGEAKLSANDLANCDSIQLSKSATEPVTLLAGPTAIASGELVILGRELAVRIVKMAGN